MEYSKLVAVTGLSGLYELVASRADGGVVRSLEDKSTKFVSNRQHNFSHLESIEVYTVNGNVNLAEVFNAMKESKEAKPASKDDAKGIKAYFEKVYPDLDFERVYSSDMKKMLRWFDILGANGIEPTVSGNHAGENESHPEKKSTASSKSEAKPASVKNAPARKVNAPRKMA